MYSREDQIRENGIQLGDISIGYKEFLGCQNEKETTTKKTWNGLLRGNAWSFVRHIIKKD